MEAGILRITSALNNNNIEKRWTLEEIVDHCIMPHDGVCPLCKPKVFADGKTVFYHLREEHKEEKMCEADECQGVTPHTFLNNGSFYCADCSTLRAKCSKPVTTEFWGYDLKNAKFGSVMYVEDRSNGIWDQERSKTVDLPD